MFPLSFKEFCTDRTEPVGELWKEYYTFGGMPALRNHRPPEQKTASILLRMLAVFVRG